MSDIVADAKAWLADIGGGQRLQTHSGNCHKWHSTCLVGKLIREIERLRTLAEQATPSDGSVQEMCTLTKKEQKAVAFAAEHFGAFKSQAATLRKLLERLNT
jgi:hypothetical protein